jgi:ribose 5-phosphate isomerase A
MSEPMPATKTAQPPDSLSPSARAKRAAALKALDYVEDGMKVGLGTGSTAAWFLDLLAERIRDTGLKIVGVPTSGRTQVQAGKLGIPLRSLDAAGWLDLTVDGADEFDPDLNLIKGGGGALLHEKIIATASDKMVVIADSSKQVEALGNFPLPVEIVRFGAGATMREIDRLVDRLNVTVYDMRLRERDDGFYLSDEGHLIADLHLGRVTDPVVLNAELNMLPGVVETGLFIGVASVAIVGHEDGTARVIERPR